MNSHFIIKEYAYIGREGTGYKEEDGNLFFPDRQFQQLQQFVMENQTTSTDDVIDLLVPGYKKNIGPILKARNYVGLIECHGGLTVEILPKIYFSNEENGDNRVGDVRRILLKMLKTLRDSPFKHLDLSHLKTETMPLLEIFISMFMKEVAGVIKRGLKRDYITREENSGFLKGKLLVGEQVKYNQVHQERFFIQYDEFLMDRPENRLLKSTLLQLLSKARSMVNQKLIRDALFHFDEIGESHNNEADFNKVKTDRLMKDYELALKWCRVFLKKESFTTFRGQSVAFALLFPMERIFEEYIGHLTKKYLSNDFDVTLQCREETLLSEEKKFTLVPDIILQTKNNDQRIVIDTKWKLLDENDSRNNNNIAQSDLYQMYAYAKKYKANKIILLYPMCEKFKTLIPSVRRFEDDIQISVVPVNLAQLTGDSIDSSCLIDAIGLCPPY